ncbi:hypothetical protein [Egicoccus halophilus]|uniref:Bulb-type lectin domain-containing protein n=1 Tax=Egicoccus halophilus TaxID=1670830 RepID=A0A8J3ET38_9ACTN|nr:hypothetical protein [Egicoccus halophilus]GGI04815.1 hypothetical protein GCM10011354_10980 [Egicoccus halophilus]
MAVLKGGERLHAGQELRSNNGQYRLVMQTDGNLVLYPTAGGAAVWATHTWNRPALDRPVRADMQADGNFVLYDTLNRPVWATGTHQHPGSYFDLQDDRNLVIYNAERRPVWASGTNIPAPQKRTGSLTARLYQDVGFRKRMETNATLYRDGRLVVDSFTRNDNWTGALRGRTLAVIVDAQDRAIMVSNVFADPTRCSVADLSCASYGRQIHQQLFPLAIGQHAERVDLYTGDNVNFSDLRQRTIDVIRASRDIAKEVRDAVISVFG